MNRTGVKQQFPGGPLVAHTVERSIDGALVDAFSAVQMQTPITYGVEKKLPPEFMTKTGAPIMCVVRYDVADGRRYVLPESNFLRT